MGIILLLETVKPILAPEDSSEPNNRFNFAFAFGRDTMMTILTLADFIATVAALGSENERILFRGQRKDWPLLPKIARPEHNWKTNQLAGFRSLEQRIFETFKKRAKLLVNITDKYPESDLDWITLAQHHGLPTRLLDWCLNPLAALWFAVHEPPDNGDPDAVGVVYVYHPTEREYSDHIRDPLQAESISILEPRHVASRITVQSGVFTVHGQQYDNRNDIERRKLISNYQELKPDPDVNLTKMLVPISAFSTLRAELNRCGVNRATLFPDLDGVAKHIQWQNSHLSDEI